MSWLVTLAVALLVIWVLAQALGWVVGAALHLFWIAALILLALWLFQRFRAGA